MSTHKGTCKQNQRLPASFSSLHPFFCFYRSKANRSLYTSFRLMGYRSIIDLFEQGIDLFKFCSIIK